MPTLTRQQRAPLDVRSASVVLATGAGCGKTTVLTEKFVAMLTAEDRLPLERMVALTFTDKAAAELRRRVRRACREKLDAGDEPEYWRGVLRGLEAAPIGTFHTFCGEVVRRFAARAGVDPGFVVLDEAIAATCREEAVDRALRIALVGGDSDLRALAVPFGLGTVRAHLVRLLADRSAETLDAWGMFEPEALIARWRAAFEERVRPSILEDFADGAHDTLVMIRDHRDGFPPRMTDALTAIVALVDEVGERRDPASVLEEIRAHAKMPPGLRADKWPDPDLYATCRDTLKAFRDRIDVALKAFRFDEASTHLAAELGVRLARLAARARREFALVKRRRGGLDFDDLLLLTRDLLRDDSATVRDDLTGRYGLILVDEFQDTDPVQDEIVRRIAGDDLAAGRLFLVGDAKQSIYGFRGARPDLFVRYRAEFPAEGRLPLVENFRSRPGVLDFVNALFAGAFPDSEPIAPGKPDSLPDDLPAVAFSWPVSDPRRVGSAHLPNDPERQEGRGPNVAALRRLEASRLARLVRSWIDGGRLVRDKETNEPRPMRASDIAFLFRTLKDVAPYEQALDDEGLPFYVVGGSAFYAQQEVQDLINVLAALDDPYDSVALAGALRSPFFGLSDEALFWLSKVRRNDLSAGLALASDESALPDLAPRDRRLAVRAFELLTRWRGHKDREPIARLVDRVLDESGFEASLLGEGLGDRKRANARKLVRIARKYDERGGFALADFVARLRADLNEPPREEQAATTGEHGEVVRLLTVHKAKGLEFPVVVLPDLDRGSDLTHTPVALHPDLGPILNVKEDAADLDEESEDDPKGSLGRLVYRRLRAIEEAEEALRVFYVATTRARDLLVLSTSGEPSARTRSPALQLLLGRFHPQTGEVSVRLPEGWTAPRVEVIREIPAGTTERPRRKRPPLLAVARLIESTLSRHDEPTPHPNPPPQGGRGPDLSSEDSNLHPPPLLGREVWEAAYAQSPPRPTSINLDSSSHLPGAKARLARLVRALWLDPRIFRRGALDSIAAEVGRRQSPMSTPRLVAEAVDRLRAFVESPLGRRIAGAEEVVRDLPWSIPWPEDSPGPTAIVGALDLAYRDKDGTWTLIGLADSSEPETTSRLRLALTARLAPRLGLGPIAGLWLLAHGPDGGLRGADLADHATIEGWLSSL